MMTSQNLKPNARPRGKTRAEHWEFHDPRMSSLENATWLESFTDSTGQFQTTQRR
jgi:hypothetical protein